MLSATAAADNWKAWLDDLPLPSDFDPAVGRLQDFITGLAAASDRDRLAAELAAAQQREAGLADFIAEFAAAKIDALRYQPAYGESPEDEPDPVVEAATVWAWQADAKAALSHNGRSGLPVPNVSLGWPLEDDVGSIIVGKVSSHNGRGE